MKKYLLSLLALVLVIITAQAASAATVSHVYWLDDPSAQSITIEEGTNTDFAWKAHTTYTGLQVSLVLLQENEIIHTYPLTCTSSTACNGYGTVTPTQYLAPGKYVLQLTSTDLLSDCCSTADSDEITLIIKEKEVVDTDFTKIIVTANPTQGDAPLLVDFTCDVVGGDAPISYKWTFGDDTSSTTKNPSHTYTSPGTYEAICTATDVDGDSISGSVMVKVTTPYIDEDIDSITFTATPTTGNRVVTSTFTCSATGGNAPLSYKISFEDGSSYNTNQVTKRFTTIGEHTATCVVTDADGDTKTATTSVTVTLPNVDSNIEYIFVSATPTSGDAALTSNFSCSVIGGNSPISYQWSFGDGTSSTKQHPSHTYEQSGTYTATCTATDVDGDSISGSVTITVNETAVENQPPVMEEIPDQTIQERKTFTYELQVSDPDNTKDELTCYDAVFFKKNDEVATKSALILKSQPDWMVLEDCTLTGTAPEVQNDEVYIVRVGVRDPAELFDEEEFTITVLQKNRAPNIAPVTDKVVSEETSFTEVFAVSDPDYDDLTCSLVPNTSIPTWMKIVDCSLIVTTPKVSADRTVPVAIRVTDEHGAYDETNFTVTVTNTLLQPTALFNWTPISPYANEQVSFTDKSFDEGSIVAYEWSFGDGKRSTAQHPVHSFKAQGDVLVSLTVKDNDGLTNTYQQTITVQDRLPASISVKASPATGYAPLEVQFTCGVRGGDDPFTYRWDFDDGQLSAEQNPVHTYEKAGSYTPECIATDADGDKISGTVLVVVSTKEDPNHAPVIEPIRDHSIDELSNYKKVLQVSDPDNDEPLTCFSNGDLGYGIVLPHWLTLNKETCTLSGTAPSVDEDTVFYVEVGVQDPKGAVDVEYYYVTVKNIEAPNMPPIANFTWSPNNPEHVDEVTFTSTSYDEDGTIKRFAWDFDNDGVFDLITQEATVSHAPFSVGKHLITLKVTDDDGATDQITKELVVGQKDYPLENITITAVPKVGFSPLNVSFTCLATGGNAPISYAWDFGDNTSANEQNPHHVFVVGNYTVTCTATDADNDTLVASTKIEAKKVPVINQPPVASFSYTPANPLENEEVRFNDQSYDVDGTILKYEWSFDDGTTSTARNPEHSYPAKGTYTVTLKVTDDDGLSDSETHDVIIRKEIKPIIIDEFGCNPDVVQGKEEYCAIHVTDKDGADLANVSITMMYSAPSEVQGVFFGTCVTNFKGFCHVDPIVNYEPGYYTVEATAFLPDYVAPAPVNDTFKVWKERYEIVGLEVFEDEAFTLPQDTFYRGEDMYASFTVYDLIDEKYVCDENLIEEMFLRINNDQPLYFEKVTDDTWLASIKDNVLEWFKKTFGKDVDCMYEYWLSTIPLTDDYLGEGKVFAFMFNFSDQSAGQASKRVTVLNNPVSLIMPSEFIITKFKPVDTSSIFIDVKDYVSDVETLPKDMVYAIACEANGADEVFLVGTDENNVGVFELIATSGFVDDLTCTFSVDDTDGSKATATATIVVKTEYVNTGFDVITVSATPSTGIEKVNSSLACLATGGNVPISYRWIIGGKVFHTQNMNYLFDAIGTFEATCIATDVDGDSIQDTVTIDVSKKPYLSQCNDGKDNDNDGFVDMADQNCDSPSDNSEYGPISTGAEDGLYIMGINTYSFWGYETIIPGELVTVEVALVNKAGGDLEDLRVGFSVPDLGVKQKSQLFDLDDGEQETIVMSVYIPYDADFDEYYTEITVANTDLRRSTHRMLMVIDE